MTLAAAVIREATANDADRRGVARQSALVGFALAVPSLRLDDKSCKTLQTIHTIQYFISCRRASCPHVQFNNFPLSLSIFPSFFSFDKFEQIYIN